MGQKIKKIGTILAVLWVSMMLFQVSATASVGEIGTETQRGPSTSSEVYAGVAVDYMGKLKFLVRDRDSKEPIEGASVEIYVESLDSYVLFGMTDSEGIYELDVAYATEESDATGNYEQDGDQIRFRGTLARLVDNNIRWKVYKKDYLEYPTTGSLELDSITLPHVVEVYLYKEKDPTVTPTDSPKVTATPQKPGRTALPKTGVEYQTRRYLMIAAGFLLAAMILGILLYRSRKHESK